MAVSVGRSVCVSSSFSRESDKVVLNVVVVVVVVVVDRPAPGRRPLNKPTNPLFPAALSPVGESDESTVVLAVVVVRPAPGLRPPNRPVSPLVLLAAAWASAPVVPAELWSVSADGWTVVVVL